MRSARGALPPVLNNMDETLLARTCTAVKDWLDQADDADRVLALEALQIAIIATRESATITGVLPPEASEFFSEKRASACTFNTAKLFDRPGIPFRETIALA